MKHKVSISIDHETMLKVFEAIRTKQFRNKSHVFEFAVNQVIGR